ncbi:MAG TPA: serine hydrolase domain-containing protein [Longimicrobium sp.]
MLALIRRRSPWLLVPALLALAAPALAAQPAPPGDAELAREADHIAGTYASLDRFSGAVLVARNGHEIFSRAYGRADLERGTPNAVDTRFDLGSLSKQFTAAAILRLEAEGKLSVNDPVSKHLPDYPRPAGDQVTLHHLLTHTSGIPSLFRRGELENVEPDCAPRTLEQLLAYSRDLPLQFTPGERYRYSNSGYTLLAAVVERVSGMPFDEYLRTALFAPAGMRDTGRPDPAAPGARDATGYDGYAPELKRAPCVHPAWNLGGGGIFSTVGDLHRWERALAGGRILPAAQLEKFYHPYVGRGRAGAGYAYGWFTDSLHGRPLVSHGGTSAGFVAEFYRFPEDSLLVVVLSNRLPALGVDVPAEIARRIAARALGKAYELPPLPAAVPAAELPRYAGRYRVAPGREVVVELRDGRLIATAAGEGSWSLATAAAQRALAPGSDSVAKGMRILDAFAAGNLAVLRGALAPRRAAEVSDSSLLWLRGKIDRDARFGRLVKASPWRTIADRNGYFVDARMTFEKGEWFVRAELDGEGRLMGWYYGTTLPSRVELRPEGGGRFFVDAFRWEEPDLRVRFVSEGGRVTEMVIEDPAGPVHAPRIGAAPEG